MLQDVARLVATELDAARAADALGGSHRSLPRQALAAIAFALVVACVVWAPVPPAAAHDELVASDPSESGLVQELPSRAILTFSGEVTEIHEITVTGPDGTVTNGDPTASGVEVRQTLWAGPDGAYTMAYDVVSADGHEIQGEIHFDVGAASTAASDAASTAAPGIWERNRTVMLTVGLLLLATAAALVLRSGVVRRRARH